MALKTPHPFTLKLNILASKIERNLLAPDEAAAVAKALRDLANGGSFEESLGVKRPSGRPSKNIDKQLAAEVTYLMLPENLGGKELGVIEASKEVAVRHNLSLDRARKAYEENPDVRKVVRDHWADSLPWKRN